MQDKISSLPSDGLLIVLELAAEWPSLPGLAVAPASRRVLSQDETESPAAFAVRVGEQLDGLFARGVALKNAVIACNDRLDGPASTARAELSRAAASAMARALGGSLLLIASDRNEGRGREAFGALAAELSKEWQSGAVETQLQFGGEVVVTTEPSAKPSPSSRRGKAKDGARRVA